MRATRRLSLTERQFQVLGGLVAGLSVKAIAIDLAVSVPTVSAIKTVVFEKLGLLEKGKHEN